MACALFVTNGYLVGVSPSRDAIKCSARLPSEDSPFFRRISMRRHLISTVSALLFVLSTTVANAQPFNRPIRIIVPTPPGTTMDTLARGLGQVVSPVVGQPVIVENKTGADGAIAGNEVVQA